MKNLLTRKEIEEQFGHLLLEFDFFCGSTFAFSGHDAMSDCWVTLYIKGTSMSFVGAKSSTSVKDALKNASADVRFFIVDKDLRIIYED